MLDESGVWTRGDASPDTADPPNHCTTMSSSTSASTAPKDSAAEAAKDEAKPQPTHMTALEEDDEFEEFPVQGADARPPHDRR